MTADPAQNLPPDIQIKLKRLAELETILSSARHDVRGMLTPMLLIADRLAVHTDAKVVRMANTLILSIRRIDELLAATKRAD